MLGLSSCPYKCTRRPSRACRIHPCSGASGHGWRSSSATRAKRPSLATSAPTPRRQAALPALRKSSPSGRSRRLRATTKTRRSPRIRRRPKSRTRRARIRPKARHAHGHLATRSRSQRREQTSWAAASRSGCARKARCASDRCCRSTWPRAVRWACVPSTSASASCPRVRREAAPIQPAAAARVWRRARRWCGRHRRCSCP
mmetsp:Transcript_94663/g.272559  ORF Transcript_94663/g.272559 Transcript_94663/m.272559 type:complete len:201 (+) Transcript_94663:199-801(+)